MSSSTAAAANTVTVGNRPPWQWITRSVEPTVEKWLHVSSSVVLIRGQRRSGKSSTLKRCAKKLNKKVIELFVRDDPVRLVEAAQAVFQQHNDGQPLHVKGEFDIGNLIIKSIKNGYIVIIEEIQNASNSFQITLQQVCDTIAFDSLYCCREWEHAGCLFLMGSLPSLVDIIMENRRNPLFQRVSAKITVYQFDAIEMTQLFEHLGISDPSLQLSLHSIFGGKPHAYKIAYQAGVFQGNNTNVKDIVKEYFASELQNDDFYDAKGYFEVEFGATLANAIRAVCDHKDKSTQEKKAGNDGFKLLHNDLYCRYGVIEPCVKISNLTSIARYEITDPLLILVDGMSSTNATQIKREDVDRVPQIPTELFEMMEGLHFERWIKEIAQDRHLLCSTSCFPHLPCNGVCDFTPKIVWDIRDAVEIDILASHPVTNTLIYGSCKRSASKIDHKNLIEHVKKLEHDKMIFVKLLKHLKLKEEGIGKEKVPLSRIYYHFVPSIDDALRREKIDSFSAWNHHHDDDDHVYIVTLSEMLKPFRDTIEKNTHNIFQPILLDPVGTKSAEDNDHDDDRHIVDDVDDNRCCC